MLTAEHVFANIKNIKGKDLGVMKQITIDRVQDLIHNQSLISCKKSRFINQDNGSSQELMTREVLHSLNRIRNPIFQTDDDGMIRVVTLDIYFQYRGNDLYTGCIIRVFFRRVQKRIQSSSSSNGVGAPHFDHDCILPFTNN